jgi:2-methylene-furan-3-one reductase
MKAVTASAFGVDSNKLLSISNDRVKPKLAEAKGNGQGFLLVRVQACSLSPSDYRMLTGDASLVKKPRIFPYVPGGDVCGVVEEVGEVVTGFKVGDSIVGTWNVWGEGGLAEYTLVDSKLAVLKPDNISAVQGAALANSAGHAICAVRAAAVSPGNRVLVLGGSGGVGSSIVQLSKMEGAAFIAATSTDAAMVTSLGADRVIDYTKEEWWTLPEFQAEPFDVIIDCAEGYQAWTAANKNGLLSGTGRFIAVVLNEWGIVIKNPMHLFSFLAPPAGRMMRKIFWPFGPRYKMFLGDVDGKVLKEVMALVQAGELKPVLDPKSPFPFTEEGVKAAWKLHESRHGHGKVVIEIAK